MRGLLLFRWMVGCVLCVAPGKTNILGKKSLLHTTVLEIGFVVLAFTPPSEAASLQIWVKRKEGRKKQMSEGHQPLQSSTQRPLSTLLQHELVAFSWSNVSVQIIWPTNAAPTKQNRSTDVTPYKPYKLSSPRPATEHTHDIATLRAPVSIYLIVAPHLNKPATHIALWSGRQDSNCFTFRHAANQQHLKLPPPLSPPGAHRRPTSFGPSQDRQGQYTPWRHPNPPSS